MHQRSSFALLPPRTSSLHESDLSSRLPHLPSQYADPPEIYSSVAFASFVVVWSYFRHFLNLKILWNVWDDVKRIKPEYRVWAPERELFAPSWSVRHLLLLLSVGLSLSPN